MMTSVLLWLLASMAVGVVLLVLGLRGKRLNDHPVCRQCRFDLVGCPEGTVTCPECGAGLKRPGYIRIGQRRRRPVAMAAGLALVGLPAAAVATAGFAILTGSDVHKYMPLGVLLWEAGHADAARSKAVAAEMLSRYNAKALDADQSATVVQRALAIQGDPRIPWAVEWGDLIETAISDGLLNEADRLRFRNQAAVMSFKVRPGVRSGDPLPVVATLKEARIGGSSALMSYVVLESATLDDTGLRRAKGRIESQWPGFSFESPMLGWLQMYGASTRFGWGGARMGDAKLALDLPPDIGAGRHSLAVRLRIKTFQQTPNMSFTWPNTAPPTDDPEWALHAATMTVDVSGAQAPGIELVTPTPEQRERMQKLLDTTTVRYYGNGLNNTAMMQFSIEGRPLEGAFDVVWRRGEREWKLGSFTTGTSANEDQNWFGPEQERTRAVQSQIGGFQPGQVDVVLRPSAEAALRTVDLTRIYGEEIVFKDVAVAEEHNGVYSSNGTVSPSGGAIGWILKALGGR